MATSRQAQEAQDAAIREAMMEELGIARIENLPMSDRLHSSNHDHQPDPVARTSNVSRPARTTTIATSGDNSVSAMWQSAISSGIFNDKDAAEVKDLDDLGGGRLYEARTRTQHAKARTSQILSGMNAFSNKSIDTASRGHGLRNDGREATPMHRLVGRARRFARSTRPLPSGDQPLVEFMSSRNTLSAASAQANIRLEARQQARLQNEELERLFSKLKVVVKEPAFNVYKTLVLHKHGTGQTPAVLFLSAKAPPLMGDFDLISAKGSIAHHSLDQWFNYVTGALDELMPQFKSSVGLVTTYGLVFRNKTDVPRFVEIITELKDGKHMHLLSATSPESATSTASRTEAKQATLPVHGTASNERSMQSSESILLSKTEPVDITIKPPPSTTVVESNPPAEPPKNGSSLLPLVPTIMPEANAVDYDPFNLFGSAPAFAQPDQPQAASSLASHLELLATLDCVPREEASTKIETQVCETLSQDGSSKDAAYLPPEAQAQLVKQMTQDIKDWIVQTTRSLLSCFLLGRDPGDTKTDIAATIEGIKDGLVAKCLEHLESPSFPRGLSIEQKQEILDEFLSGAFGNFQNNQLRVPTVSTQVRRSTPLAPVSSISRCSSYSRQDLLMLKGNATEPPVQLQEPEFTPLRRKQPTTSVNSSQSLNFSAMKDSVVWAQGSPKTSKKLDDAASDTRTPSIVVSAQVDKSKSPEPAASPYCAVQLGGAEPPISDPKPDTPKGLGHSRWISTSKYPMGGQMNFTGPGYEFRPGSALYQLNNLSMRAKIETSTKDDDILDLFIPLAKSTAPEMNGPNAAASENIKSHQSHIVSNSLSELYESFEMLKIESHRELRTQASGTQTEPIFRRSENTLLTTTTETVNPITTMTQKITSQDRAPSSTNFQSSLADAKPSTNGLAASRHARR